LYYIFKNSLCLTNNQEIMGEVRTALWLMKNDMAMEPDNLPAKV